MDEHKLQHDITVDLHRTDPENKIYDPRYNSGNNPLFNVLSAYAHFDPEINYCQGMNLIASWLLKFLQEPTNKGHLEYNEEDAFYLLVHVCVRLQWREIY
jgi:hypothetical protein